MSIPLSQLKEEFLCDPLEIVRELDKHVIGHQSSKSILALVVLNRALLCLQSRGMIDLNVPITRSNVLLIGESGSGKTALIKALKEVTDIPIHIADITNLTASGYYGLDVETVLIEYVNGVVSYVESVFGSGEKLYDILEGSPPEEAKEIDLFATSLVKNGIIYLDEIDKVALQPSGGKFEVHKDAVQNELLKILDGSTVSLVKDSSEKSRWKKSSCLLDRLDTTNITFIGGGAFAGLDDIIKTRLKVNNSIGFNSVPISNTIDKLKQKVKTEDLVLYGFKAEFLNRLPVRTVLDPLTVDVMSKIIASPKNSILAQYQSMFSVFDVDLKFDKKAIKDLAKRAIELKMGARSLAFLFNGLFKDVLLNIYSYSEQYRTLVVTSNFIKQQLDK